MLMKNLGVCFADVGLIRPLPMEMAGQVGHCRRREERDAEGFAWMALFLMHIKVVVDGVPPTRYREVLDAQLEAFLWAPEGAPTEVLELLRRIVVAGHLAHQGLGGVGGAGGGDLGAGPRTAVGGALETTTLGAPRVPWRDPVVPLAIVSLARFPPPPPKR